MEKTRRVSHLLEVSLSPPKMTDIVFVAATTMCSRTCNQRPPVRCRVKDSVRLTETGREAYAADDLGIIACCVLEQRDDLHRPDAQAVRPFLEENTEGMVVHEAA